MERFFFNDEFRQGIGLTDEQYAQVEFMYSKDGSMGHWYRTKAKTNPELAAVLEESDRLKASLRGNDPYGENLTEEDKQAIIANSEKESTIYHSETQRDIENLLTPEQMQQVRESELALMSEIPILNPSMFHSLDLTDEQKEQMETVKKTLEPEFEQIVEELVQVGDALQQLKFDMFEKVGIKFDQNGRPIDEDGKSLRQDREAAEKKGKEMQRELFKNVEMQARLKRINDRASGFMRNFKFKMFDVLTDEQMARMQRIIDNPAEYIKQVRDRLQKERAGREQNEWQPGLDSWRPGDPLPEEYLKQRRQRRNFPATAL